MKQITIKKQYKKSLVTSSFYILALTSCSTMRNNMNMQKGSDKDCHIKLKLALEADRTCEYADADADAAFTAFEAACIKARAAAPKDRAAAMTAKKTAKAELKAKSAAAEAAFKSANKAHDEADAAYEAAYPEEAKAQAATLAPALAAAGKNVAARAAVYGRFALEARPSVNASSAFIRNYLQDLGNTGNISTNRPDLVANVVNTDKTHTKAAVDRSTHSQAKTNHGGKLEARDKRFNRS